MDVTVDVELSMSTVLFLDNNSSAALLEITHVETLFVQLPHRLE